MVATASDRVEHDEGEDRNEIVLRGRISAGPQERVLPSGARVVVCRLVVARGATVMTRGSRQRSDWVECAAWAGEQRRKLLRWEVGDVVEVSGALRRRHYRAGTAASSVVEVEALCEAHDTTVLDLDGVVYVGAEAVPGAPEHLRRARERGTHLAYVTNNASRTPGAVEDKLSGLGVPVAPGDVVTSAQAAARVLAEQLEPGARVFLIGGDGLETALVDAGLTPVTEVADEPQAVVQGFGPDMPWGRVVAGATLVRRGLPWVASNTDMTFPTQDGLGPGNGTLVRLIADFAEREPVVAGKPSPPLLQETQRRVGGQRPLMVGDRLDTDIAGALAVQWPSLLVLTGVTGLAELVAARPGERPTYLAEDLGGLLVAHPEPQRDGDAWVVGGWRAQVGDGRLRVDGDGTSGDWWRAVAASAWSALDEEGAAPDCSGLCPPEQGER
ncbi:hypothetical protein LUZ63_020597 [Rhynchospora breviuscula]|uniref:Uncharacterized protein n=1 Tax=Rhynchospora breviuscula TaxID=2022672 RepID=A0A9Q0C0F7_9POAL|nr:hypothetical protein LUZ63_020597 [Rhynchospora breviuscula]